MKKSLVQGLNNLPEIRGRNFMGGTPVILTSREETRPPLLIDAGQ